MNDKQAPDWASSIGGKRALVVGGAGFIGSHVSLALDRHGAHVTVADLDVSSTRASLINTVAPSSRLRRLQLDVRRRQDVYDVLRGGEYDFVFHFSAVSVIERSSADPVAAIDTNAMGWINVMEAVRQHSPTTQALVLSSTDKVYGEIESEYYREDSPLRGVGVYEAAKLAADVLAQTYIWRYGLPISVLRLCNVFGAHDYNVDYRLIPRSLKLLFRDAMPPVLYESSVGHSRDYVYIDDAVEAILRLAHFRAARGQVFNMLGCCHMRTQAVLQEVVRVAAAVQRAHEPESAARMVRQGVLVEPRRDGHPVREISEQRLDGSRLKAVTGFEPRVPFTKGLETTARFYQRLFHSARQGVRERAEEAANIEQRP